MGSKREAALKSRLTEALTRRRPDLLIYQFSTAGAPDRHIVGGRPNAGSYWECKHGTPYFESPGLQVLQMLRLAQFAPSYYIVWEERNSKKRTLIIPPSAVRDKSLVPIESFDGFDMDKLVEYIAAFHTP